MRKKLWTILGALLGAFVLGCVLEFWWYWLWHPFTLCGLGILIGVSSLLLGMAEEDTPFSRFAKKVLGVAMFLTVYLFIRVEIGNLFNLPVAGGVKLLHLALAKENFQYLILELFAFAAIGGVALKTCETKFVRRAMWVLACFCFVVVMVQVKRPDVAAAWGEYLDSTFVDAPTAWVGDKATERQLKNQLADLAVVKGDTIIVPVDSDDAKPGVQVDPGLGESVSNGALVKIIGGVKDGFQKVQCLNPDLAGKSFLGGPECLVPAVSLDRNVIRATPGECAVTESGKVRTVYFYTDRPVKVMDDFPTDQWVTFSGTSQGTLKWPSIKDGAKTCSVPIGTPIQNIRQGGLVLQYENGGTVVMRLM